MTTVTETKTITNTAAAVFAGSSVLANRVFVYVRNLDDCVQIKINGRIVEQLEANGVLSQANSKGNRDILT